MKQNLKGLPDINVRIQSIINERFNGNVRRFSLAMGLPDSSKINRLFNKDKRSGEYPIPSTDIILLIANTCNVSADWLLIGYKNEEDTKKTVNNIDITKNSIKGDNNVTGNGNTVTKVADLMELIKAQQEQINTLLSIVKDGGKL